MDSLINEENTTAKMAMKKNRQRSPSSATIASSEPVENDPSSSSNYRRSSSLSLSAEFANTTLEATLKQSMLDKEYASLSMNSNASPLLVQKHRLQEGSGLISLKSQHSDRGVSWRWLRTRKGLRTKGLSSPRGRRSTDSTNTRLSSTDKSLQRQVLLSEKEAVNEIDHVAETIDTGFSFSSDSKNKSREKDQCHSSTSLSSKYQPKFFEDVAGHEIIVKALSNAVQKQKIAPLYLFHGPGGTGKTSTARIFSMALNCESTTHTKPCWNCRGCNRSLYIMDLCSGSRISGFERIRTLLQSTAFTQIVTGFKVFVIEECHSLTTEAWDEIQSIVEKGSGSTVVFVMITEDVNMVPKGVSSRCQKFCFPKLKDMDITMKLAQIVSREAIEIEREALRLITSKANGSMREAENILDQLGLLGSRVTSPMVQQIVGLVPHNKLLDLLTTVLSADTIKTVRYTRELIASGVQPQSILSQLASLIMDILSSASITATTSSVGTSKDKGLSRMGSQLSDSQSERLSSALKMLVDTEKHLSSSNDHTNWVVATLLQIASDHTSNRISGSIVLPKDIIVPTEFKFDDEIKQISTHMHSSGASDHLRHNRRKSQQDIDKFLEESNIYKNDSGPLAKSATKTRRHPSGTVLREPTLGQIGNMEDVWQNILGKIQSPYVKEFLSRQGKIASLTISSANVIVHIMFKRPQDKLAAQMSEETIESALQDAFGCPVTINMSLQPMQMGNDDEGISVSSTKGKEIESSRYRQQHVSAPFPTPSESPGNQNASRKSPATRMQNDTQTSECQERRPSVRQDSNTRRLQQVLPFSGPLALGNDGANNGPANDSSATEQIPISAADIKKATNLRHRWLSLSTIQQGDASVERYSQDLLFENENTDREKGKKKHSKLFKGFTKDDDNQHHQYRTRTIILNRSWSCSDSLCPRGTKVMKRMG